eukprot:7775995-Lingulodinium_polyedra.AAC.1
MGAAACAATPKLAATLVACAARGAVQGALPAVASAEPVKEVAELLVVLGVRTMPEGLAKLRQGGRQQLATRLQKLSRARNAVAHPDVRLRSQIEEFVSLEAVQVDSTSEEQRPDERRQEQRRREQDRV